MATIEWAPYVDDIFNQAWTYGTQKAVESNNYLDQAVSATGEAPTVVPVTTGFTPTVIEPQVNIPSQAEGASVAKFNELATTVITQLSAKFAEYMTTYFPDDSAYLTETESWLYSAIKNGGTGIPSKIQTQIWEGDRSRILKEADRLVDETISTWAARRFPMPPGAATHQALMINQSAYEKIAESSRQQAIKNIDIEIENIRFAVQQSVLLYNSATQAAMEYIRSVSIGYTASMQVVPSITDSQSKLIGAASEYYRARISVEDLKLKASLSNAEFAQQAELKNKDYRMEKAKLRVDAATEAAKSLGVQAASALNSLHASAGLSQSQSASTSYSYQGEA
jgi:hypothetical protein